MLDTQFRMHPDIADFISHVFYQNRLRNGVSEKDRSLIFDDFNNALCLISTSAYKDRHEIRAGETSFANELELELTLRVLQKAQKFLDVPAQFGIVTPYAGQRDLMHQRLSDFFDLKSNLKIGREDVASVDSFQGSERDVMICSFVRSPSNKPKKCPHCKDGHVNGKVCSFCGGRGILGSNLAWVHDLRRLNVAFSRARKMLILIGDIEVLTDPKLGNQEGADVLTRFREHVLNRGTFRHLWEKGIQDE